MSIDPAWLQPTEFLDYEHPAVARFADAGNQHMEYVGERGSFDDLPLAQMFATFRDVYPMWRDADGRGSDAAGAGDSAFT